MGYDITLINLKCVVDFVSLVKRAEATDSFLNLDRFPP